MTDDPAPDPGLQPDRDTDTDTAGPERGTPVLRGQGAAVAAVSLGGVLGALARWAVGLALPAAPGTVPLGTILINVAGCLAMGALVVVVTEWPGAHPLARPFLGVGVLGGFTTFSTYAVDAQALVEDGRPGAAGAYLAATALGAVTAVAVGLAVTRRLLGHPRAAS